MKGLILCAVLAFVSSAQIQADDNIICDVGGPKFWCENHANAQRCRATNYCKEYVWKKVETSKVSDDVCSECQQYVGILHGLLADNNTRNEMMQAMDAICSLLPTELQSQCNALIQTYGNQAYDMILQMTTDPKAVCTQLGFCTGTKAAFKRMKILRQFLKNLNKVKQYRADECTTCEQYVGTIHLLISNNETRSEVLSELVQLCQMAGGSSSECTLIVNVLGEKVFDALVNYLADPSKLCTTIGFCSSPKHVLLLRKKPATSIFQISRQFNSLPKKTEMSSIHDSVCTLCLNTVHFIQDVLNDTTVRNVLKDVAENLCSFAPPQLFSSCLSFVIKRLPKYYNEFIKELNPNATCAFLTLCDPSSNYLLKNSLKLVYNLPKGQDLCEVCTLAVTYLDSVLKENSTQQEIKSAVLSLCGDLPDSLKTECTGVVNQYWDAAMSILLQFLADPQATCTGLHLCNSTKVTKKPVKANPITCEVCEYAMQYLDGILAENSTEAEVRAALDNMCGYLPASVQSECTSLVDQYADVIVKLIVEELANPAEVCKELGLCSASLKASLKKKPVKANPVTCEVCEYAMQYLDGLLTENATEAEVKAALDSLCGYLPQSMKIECTSLVDQYSDDIIKLIVEQLANPEQVCKELGLCTSSMKVSYKKAPIKANPVTCEVCEYAMNYLEGILTDNATETEVKAALDKVCGYLPESAKSECTTLVNEYSEQIIKFIVQEFAKPAEVCKLLGLCSSSKISHKKSPIKANPVTCEVCEYAMNYLEGILTDNATETEVRAALDKMCGYLPASVKSECTILVNQYADQIIKLIVQQFAKPAEVCKLLGMCTSSKGVQTDVCEVCEDVVEVLDNLLKEDRTQAAIKSAVERVCSFFSSSTKDRCVNLIDQYGGILIDLLAKELKPDAICKELRVCSSTKQVPTKKSTIEEKIQSSVTCELCNFAMGKLISELKDNKTDAEIRQAVLGLCSKLPAHLSDECKLLVDEYGEVIIKAITEEVDPTAVCEYIGLCKQKYKISNRKHMLEVRLALDGVSCELCEAALGYIDTELKKNATEAEIKDLVINLCSHLPTVIKNECDALITEYGNELIDLIAQQIQPDKICKALKIC